jgi:general secretion pathway protein G
MYRRGFTLLEMIIVVAIIAVLASVVAPNLARHASDAKVQAARSQLEMIGLALESYKVDTDEYPSSEDGLKALNERPATLRNIELWRGPYLKRDIPLDPWGNQYVYRNPSPSDSTSFDLLSMGKDGSPGGTGDKRDIVVGRSSAETAK